MLTPKEVSQLFSDSEHLLEALAEANALTLKHHGSHVTLERAIFLSWWCSVASCAFCYMAKQKERLSGAEKAKRAPWRILAEAELMRRLGWEVEFLSGGYGAYTLEELRLLAEMVAYAAQSKVWLNVGVLSGEELEQLGRAVEGVTGSVECVSKKLRSEIVPGKPLAPIKRMLIEAKEMGYATGITIILGLGESVADTYTLLELIQELKLDRITIYALNPHRGTRYENSPPPASLYQAGVIAAVRISFPEVKIISGTWVDQLPNIGIALLAGANGITKFPLFSMFGTRHGRKVEEEVRHAGRELLGTFSDVDVLQGSKALEPERDPRRVFKRSPPEISQEAKERLEHFKPRVKEAMAEYVEKVLKNISKKEK
jgi:biotin synthase-like enzyme